MKILLTGALTRLHWGMVPRLNRDGHHVTLLGHDAAPQPGDAKAAFFDLSPNHPNALTALKTGGFDAIVFFYAYDAHHTLGHSRVHGALLDSLFQYHFYAQQSKITNFILVTDYRVFGMNQPARERDEPIPDTAEGVLIKAAEDCSMFAEDGGLKTLLVRVGSLYAPGDPDGLFARALTSSNERHSLSLCGTQDAPLDMLHVDDLAAFINIALDRGAVGRVHLLYDQARTNRETAAALTSMLPELSITFTDEPTRMVSPKVGDAHTRYDWVPRHDWMREIGELMRAKSHENWFSRIRRGIARGKPLAANKIMGYVELMVIGWIIAQLSRATEQYAMFRFVDFWLFYVILMGSMHGTLIGLAASIITCIFYGLDWVRTGNEAYLLLINVDNWLPMAMYVLCGGLFGYIHQSSANKIAKMSKEKEQMNTDRQFIETLFLETYDERNKLQEQVMRSRDSYGRIYNIARELDTLQPEQVFLSTLNVLEDAMQSRSVALYSLRKGASFMRLVVHSRKMLALPKSMDLRMFSELERRLRHGELFCNTALMADYPAFAAPVMQEGEPIAAVIMWEVPFEKQTLYQRNLFKVVVGLVQSALIRALAYLGTSQDMYLPDTFILTDAMFRSTVEVHKNMRKQQAASFLLLKIEGADGANDPREIDERLRRATRNTDICGRLDNGTYYALLPQASLDNLPQIEKRMSGSDLRCVVAALESIDAA